MIDGFAPQRDGNRNGARAGQQLFIAGSDLPPPCVPCVQVSKLDPQDCTLQAVHPAVPPDEGMLVLLSGPAVIASLSHAVREIRIRGDDGSGVAACPQVLARVEAETAGLPEVARLPAMAGRSLSLGRILDHRDVMPTGNGHHGAHIDAAAIQVHRHDSPG